MGFPSQPSNTVPLSPNATFVFEDVIVGLEIGSAVLLSTVVMTLLACEVKRCFAQCNHDESKDLSENNGELLGLIEESSETESSFRDFRSGGSSSSDETIVPAFTSSLTLFPPANNIEASVLLSRVNRL